MTSKNSFWKYSIWNLKKRSWILTLSSALWLFSLPIFTYLSVSGLTSDYWQIQNKTTYDYIELVYEILNTNFYSVLPFVIAIVLGIFMAIQSFAWINKRQKVDMYKSVPVKETSRFLYIHLNSLFIYAVPFALCLLASNLIVLGYRVYNIVFVKASFIIFLVCVLTFLSVYMLVLVAQLLTGNMILAFFGGLFLLFVEPACRLSVYMFQDNFLDTFCNVVGTSAFISKNITSPVLAGWSCFLSFRNSIFNESFSFRYYRWGLGLISDNLYYVVLLLLQITVYTGIAYWLYKKRAAQTGGKAIVFAKAIPILKIIIIFTISFGVGVLMTIAGNYYNNAITYGLVGIILAAVLMHLILGGIIEGDFNATMKKAVKSLPASLLACGLSCFIFFVYAFDLFGFDTYLPKADELAGFSFMRPDNPALNVVWDEEYEGEIKMNITDEHAKEVLLTVLQDAMQREQYTGKNDFGDEPLRSVRDEFGIDSELVYRDENRCESVYVTYYLNNGKTKERRYCLLPTDARKIYASFYATSDYKDIANPFNIEYVMDIIKDTNMEKQIIYTSYDFESLTQSDHQKHFSQEEVEALAKAAKADINDRTYEDLITKAPVGMIAFGFQNPNEESKQWDTSSYTYYAANMVVYESDERTVSLLKSFGLYKDTQIPLDEVAKINVYCEDTVVRENVSDANTETATEVIQRVLSIEPDTELAKKVIEDAFPMRAQWNAIDVEMMADNDYIVEVVPKNGETQQYALYTIGFPQELKEAMKDAKENNAWVSKDYY